MPLATLNATKPTCVRCGKPLPEAENWCPACGKLNASLRVRLIFVAVLVSIVAGVGFTKWYVSYLKNLESSLAQQWFTRGEEAMARNYPEVAIDDYRNALAYEGDNPEYRLKLAEALMAASRLPEARAYLMSLWSQTPADAEVNLDLARLYIQENKPDLAITYYRSAIDGAWSDNALQHRVDTRFELLNYLLQHGDRARAVAEAIELQAEAPDNAPTQLRIGELLLQLGEKSRAEKTLEGVIKDDPNNTEAWFGAGEAALSNGDYRKAVRLLTTAVNLSSAKPGGKAAQQLALAREVVEADPNIRTLKLTERAARAAAAFNLAMDRLRSCAAERGITLAPEATVSGNKAHPPLLPNKQNGYTSEVTPPTSAPNVLQQLYNGGLQRQATATAKALRATPDAIAPTMEFVFETMSATEPLCPPETPQQRALLLLAGHEAEEPR